MEAQVSRVVRSAHALGEQAGNIHRVLCDLAARDYPNPEARLLMGTLENACRQLQDRAAELTHAAEAFAHQEGQLQRVFRLIQRYHQVLKYLHGLLAYLADADVYALPPVLSGVLRRRIRQRAEDVHVYLHADADFNYFYAPIGSWLASPLGSIGVDTAAIQQLSVLGFPRGLSEGTLSATLLAHEAGHCLYDALDLGSSMVQKAQSAGDWDRVDDCFDHLGVQPDGQLVLDPERNRRNWSQTISWLEEFAADRIAVLLFGPAFLLAWLDFTLVMQSTASPSHPPHADRTAILYEWLSADESPWRDVILGRVVAAVPWLPSTVASSTFQSAELDKSKTDLAAVTAASRALLPHLVASMEERFPASVLVEQAEDFRGRADEVFELLEMSIPPGEVMTPDDPRQLVPVRDSTVLLAGWLFLLTGMEREWAAPEGAGRDWLAARLDQHVSKALEISLLREAWQ